MRPRSTARFVLAVAVVVTMILLGTARVISAGARAGVAGVLVALVVGGFALALVFTLVYDGPRSVTDLLRRD